MTVALVECVTAWRRTRHPRWAQLAEWASGEARPVVGAGKKKADLEAWTALERKFDPGDLPRLVEALKKMPSTRVGELVPRLELRDDPRLVPLLLAMLEAPPWRASSSIPGFRAIAKALGGSRDVRARDGMAELAGRYKSIIESAMGTDVSSLLRRTAAEMEVVEAELNASDAARCAELEAKFPEQLAAATHHARAKKVGAQSEQALLEAVWAAPDDDAPRAVYADALMQSGDARGELITLQLLRAKGQATPQTRAREYELLVDAKRFAAWTAPLSQGGECLIERGFPFVVKLNARGLSPIVSHPAWSTVKRVTMLQAVAQKTLGPLFDASPSLVDAGILTEKITGLVPLERLTAASLDHLPDRATLARFTRLESLTLEMYHPRDVIVPDEDALPATLTQLTLPYRITLARPHFDRLSKLKSLAVKDKVPDDALKGCAALERLDTLGATPPALIEGLPSLRELRVGVCDVPMMGALLKAAPGIKRLELYPSFAPAHLASMLAAFFSSPLDSMGCGDLTCTKDGTLETRYFGNPRVPQILPLLPKGAVKRVRYRPYYAEPSQSGGRAPDAARIDEVRATLAPFGVEFEVAWY
jgi:uncharacterized protein (TIGR02996 family)